jgi:hypothetical protein
LDSMGSLMTIDGYKQRSLAGQGINGKSQKKGERTAGGLYTKEVQESALQ